MPLSLNYDLKKLEKFNLDHLLDVYRFNTSIEFKTNFKKFCNNKTSDIQQKFTTKKFSNFIDIENKRFTLFE
jgi:hypothetical protein